MFKCADCGFVFEEPQKINAGSLYGVGYGANDDYVDGCPECEGGFEKAYQCEECEEYFLDDELAFEDDLPDGVEWLCKKCLSEYNKGGKEC